MSATINFNNKTINLGSLPANLAQLKNTVTQHFANTLPGPQFDLKITFMNHSNKQQSVIISNDKQYQFLPRQMSANNRKITLEIVPQLTAEERRDVVIIEDEKTHAKLYINFQADDDETSLEDHDDQMETESISNDTQQENNPRPVHQKKKKTQRKNKSNKTKSPVHQCDSCGRKINRVRYESTKVEDYDLCEDCFQEEGHPYTMIQYLDNQPIKRVAANSYAQQQSTRPRYSNPAYSTPRYESRPQRRSMFDSFPGFDMGRSFMGNNSMFGF